MRLSDVRYKTFNARNTIQYPTSSSVVFPVQYSELNNDEVMEGEEGVMEVDSEEGVLYQTEREHVDLAFVGTGGADDDSEDDELETAGSTE